MRVLVTYVVEYEDSKAVPRVCSRMELAGGSLVAVSFEDAIERLDSAEERLMQLRCRSRQMLRDNLERADRALFQLRDGRLAPALADLEPEKPLP